MNEMPEKTIPEVTCGMYVNAKFEGSDKIGFEMKIDATYRDLPEVGLTQLEKELAAVITRMAEFGEAQQKVQVQDSRSNQR
jgi:hypothetical protein